MYVSAPQGGLLRSNPRSDSGNGVPKQIRSSSRSQTSSLDGELDNGVDGKAISTSHMNEYISEFAKYRDVPINNLEKDVKNRLVNLGHIFSVMRSTDHYPRILELVKQHFGSSSTVQPGTVGHFFYGCFTATDYKGPVHCSANCAGNVVPPNGPGFETCGDNVFYLTSDGQLDLRIPSDSKKAIIHVLASNFRGLTRAQVGELRRRNIEVVDIDIVSTDSKHHTVSENVPVSEIEILEISANPLCPNGNCGQSGSHPSASASGQSQSDGRSASAGQSFGPAHSQSGQQQGHQHGSSGHHGQKTNYTWVGALIFIIIVIIIVLLIFAAFRNRRSLDKPEAVLEKSAADVDTTASAVVNESASAPAAFWGGYGAN